MSFESTFCCYLCCFALAAKQLILLAFKPNEFDIKISISSIFDVSKQYWWNNKVEMNLGKY